VNSGVPQLGVSLSQLCCDALLKSQCCANAFGERQSPISFVTVEKNELVKDLSSSKMERKKEPVVEARPRRGEN